MVSHGGLISQTMASKYITFEANGVILCFKVLKIWVIILFKDQNAPFMICVHCMNHWANLSMQSLSKLIIVGKIEDVLQSLYVQFSHNLKRTQEFVELVDIVETNGQRILQTIKICSISMLLSTKKIMS